MKTSWAVCFTRPKSLPTEVLHCGNRNFKKPFCSFKLDPYCLEM